jgi:methylphosphotriester-DNA--protein-cysteine methyltransferase
MRATTSPSYPDDDARWAAALAREPAAVGRFFICVRTTGIFCKPICAARPLRKNVVFVRTRKEAEAAGFRPCKRCRP